jgi:hypothetical protein
MATTTNNGWETPDDTDLVKDGALAMRTLGQAIDTSVGTGLLAWQTWAPTLSSGWLNGNGTYDAKYCKIGKIVHWRVTFTVGSTTTKGTGMVISLPVTAAATNSPMGAVGFLTTGSTRYIASVLFNNTTTVSIGTTVASATYATWNTMTATTPFTWATGDIVILAGTYEAA